MSKILILTNMYPSKDKPYSGIFVKNQYEKIKKVIDRDVDSVHIKYMERKITGLAGSFFKYASFFFRSFTIFLKNYDVIHLHYFFPLAIIPFIYKKVYPDCKIVITFHGSDLYTFMRYKGFQRIFKIIAQDADVLIPVGQELAQELIATLEVEPDIILSAGVDQNVFYKENDTKKKYDFLFVGSFVERKGLDLICRAIREIGGCDISYCFVGSGPLEFDLISLKKEGYNITIKKNKTQNELRKIYNQAKWFLFPSRNEPFGLVVTESIFCGTPVLVSKLGGIKEQVREGFNGYFLKSTKVNSIKQGIYRVLSLKDQEYEKMVDQSLVSNKNFSLTEVCEKLVEIYQL